MKYIIDIPDKQGQAYNIHEDTGMWMDGYEKGVEAGRDDTWELIQKVAAMTYRELDDAKIPQSWITSCKHQEIKTKYEAWKKEKNEIHIGDEVKNKGLEDKGIVTYIEATRCDVLWSDGSVNEDFLMSDLYKTGRHFDEIKDFLKMMTDAE